MSKIKSSLFILIAVCSAASLSGQSFEEYREQQRQKFRDFKSTQKAEFEEYRARVNAEYAEFMRKSWTQMDVVAAMPIPARPEPPEPTVATPQEANDMVKVEVSMALQTPPRQPTKPKPLVPSVDEAMEVNSILDMTAKTAAKSGESLIEFSYYGTQCKMSVDRSILCTLKEVKESAVADCWSHFSQAKYNQVVTQALSWREALSLSDWGYYKFVDLFSRKLFGESRRNEALVLQLYMLTQSGYEGRLARCDDSIFLLLPFTDTIYKYKYFTIDNKKYYLLSEGGDGSFYVFKSTFPNEQTMSLSVESKPKLSKRSAAPRRLSSKKYGSLSADVCVNLNMIDFYNDIPSNQSWDLFSRASLSDEVKSSLYPTLRSSIEGKSETEAANILIDFVQTSLEYMTDDEQFGVERPLYGDETLYYPYSDCEDRSILFSVLIRELLGLDVVFLQYPDHLATAVKFKGSVEGDYFDLSGGRYTVCDPTYIGASIGRCMPQFKSASATIHSID